MRLEGSSFRGVRWCRILSTKNYSQYFISYPKFLIRLLLCCIDVDKIHLWGDTVRCILSPNLIPIFFLSLFVLNSYPKFSICLRLCCIDVDKIHLWGGTVRCILSPNLIPNLFFFFTLFLSQFVPQFSTSLRLCFIGYGKFHLWEGCSGGLYLTYFLRRPGEVHTFPQPYSQSFFFSLYPQFLPQFSTTLRQCYPGDGKFNLWEGCRWGTWLNIFYLSSSRRQRPLYRGSKGDGQVFLWEGGAGAHFPPTFITLSIVI